MRCRLVQTEAEQVQSRLRNLFVSRAPHVAPYLSDRTTDDWPTPYSAPRQSGSYKGWLVLVAVASALVGLAVLLAVLSVQGLSWWVAALACGVAVVVNAGVTRWVLRRVLRRKAQNYVPLFPSGRSAVLPL